MAESGRSSEGPELKSVNFGRVKKKKKSGLNLSQLPRSTSLRTLKVCELLEEERGSRTFYA